MHPKYTETIQQIADWARAGDNIQGLILIGSQARANQPSDQWSDLDLMILADDPQRLLADTGWLSRFGEVVCWFTEVVPLHFTSWNWCVRRALYADDRDVDFSILPYAELDEVLSVNQDILSKGWQVLYDPRGDLLETKVRARINQLPVPTHRPLNQAEVEGVISELIYHVIWALKKIKRGELWVAISCINGHMKGLLLQLIEAYNVAVLQHPDPLAYNGRFLEQRADADLLARLAGCFTRYDEVEAPAALERMLDLVEWLAQAIDQASGWPFDAEPFERIRRIYTAMKMEPRSTRS